MPNEARTPLVQARAELGNMPPTQQNMGAGATAPSARQAVNDDALMSAQEQTPAYRALYENNLICNQYRIRRVEDLDVIKGNWDLNQSLLAQCLTCHGCCCLVKFFVVNAGCIRRGRHQNGQYMFFGEGVHVYPSPYITVDTRDSRLTEGAILHGTKAIVTVTQGFVGLAMDRGQPVLLPPGLHQWNSPTMEFERLIDLASSVICLGPYTLITVDEGYAAVTQDNGEQKILEGGRAYMLTHRNWKFEKFMTKKLQTNDVGPIQVTTGDNVPLEATATVNWVIEDARLAARMAANTMASSDSKRQGVQSGEFDISKLRQDVLRQVTASLAAFIGSVSYSAHGHEAMVARSEQEKKREAGVEVDKNEGRRALFDPDRMVQSADHANAICERYGVKILSINLISASPSDRGLLDALSKGAVATVAAEQTETAARGEAQALLLKAKAEAEAARIRAEGDAKAEELRAEGSLKAAKRLEDSEVAIALAKIKTAGSCLKEGKANSFFFGLNGAADIPGGMLGTAALANAATAQK
ncbi:unnamed protein product [Symbiodinium natans]|uniref:Band 7 domain-containing protein n=1 Tax=Symbiodinium natans TaxID=878477 RepID=A0A812QC76_9DINO|nr:unnamed protein product [Symbiodinium natans]